MKEVNLAGDSENNHNSDKDSARFKRVPTEKATITSLKGVQEALVKPARVAGLESAEKQTKNKAAIFVQLSHFGQDKEAQISVSVKEETAEEQKNHRR